MRYLMFTDILLLLLNNWISFSISLYLYLQHYLTQSELVSFSYSPTHCMRTSYSLNFVLLATISGQA